MEDKQRTGEAVFGVMGWGQRAALLARVEGDDGDRGGEGMNGLEDGGGTHGVACEGETIFKGKPVAKGG